MNHLKLENPDILHGWNDCKPWDIFHFFQVVDGSCRAWARGVVDVVVLDARWLMSVPPSSLDTIEAPRFCC